MASPGRRLYGIAALCQLSKKGYIPADPVPREVIDAGIALGEFFNLGQIKQSLRLNFTIPRKRIMRLELSKRSGKNCLQRRAYGRGSSRER